jgi:hypothetical protein
MKRALVFAMTATLAGGVTLAGGCGQNHLMAQIDGVVLPECDESIPAEPGPMVTILPDAHEDLYKLPTGPVVRIAADRGVSWRRVRDVADRLRKQGSRPVLLVGRGITSEIRAFEPIEALQPSTHLVLDASRDGSFFVGPADTQKGTRVQAFDHQHIAKSFIRETLGPIVKERGLHDVEVRIDPHADWSDMVRAVDGARTCCPGVEMRATLVE